MAKKIQPKPKHRLIYEHIHRGIIGGEYAVGHRVPTEAELSGRFNASRLTVARAMRDLEQQGYLDRRRGAGSFVRQRQVGAGSLFGLIGVSTDRGITATICSAITRGAQQNGLGFIWGNVLRDDVDIAIKQARQVCKQYIANRVAGVFFIPLELPAPRIPVNREIAEDLRNAGIPVVLLDRDLDEYPKRSDFDLVGINNRRGGAVLTEHLLDLGYRRIHFVGRDWTVATVSARIEGYCDALKQHGLQPDPAWIHRGDYTQLSFARELLEKSDAEAFVCVNDYVAATLIQQLAALGVRVPADVAVVGFDDVEYATLVLVPLTTLRQPCEELGDAAVDLMLERRENPALPPREVQLGCQLIVRESCGAKLRHRVEARVF